MEADKYIKVTNGHLIATKQTGKVKIKMTCDNGKPFIAMLYNVLLVPELCNIFFSIIMLMNSGYTFLFHKGVCTVSSTINNSAR